jgi:hypothetical protein
MASGIPQLRQTEGWRLELNGDSADLLAARAAFDLQDPHVFLAGETTVLSSSALDACTAAKDARSVGARVLESLNLSIEATDNHYRPIASSILLEWTGENWRRHHSMVLEPGRYRLAGMRLAMPGQTPAPTLAEKAFGLIQTSAELRDVASRIAAHPGKWSDLYTAFETLKALNSSRARRDDYRPLIDKGWATQDELDRFRDSANFEDRHGYPKDPRKHAPLSLNEGVELIRRIFRLTVEERQSHLRL